MAIPSTRPYLIRALYEWCTDHGFTPYVAVHVDEAVKVPMEFVKDGQIVLNISFDATSALKIGNDYLEFKGRFGGVARDIVIPVSRVLAIYARENGEGMAFSPPTESSVSAASHETLTADDHDLPMLSVVDDVVQKEGDNGGVPPKPSGGGSRPALTRIK